MTELCQALREHDEERVKLLISTGARSDVLGLDGWMPLHLASYIGNHSMVRLFLEAGADPNATNVEGWTALHYAAFYNRQAVTKLLLEVGADPDLRTHGIGWTPLHYAAFNYRKEIVKFLLDAGANPNIPALSGSTPLHLVHFDDAVPLFLAAGADPTIANRDGHFPSQNVLSSADRNLLKDAEHVWTHTWTPEEHHRWPEDQRLERVAALSAFSYRPLVDNCRHVHVDQPRRQFVLPFLPKELCYAVLEYL